MNLQQLEYILAVDRHKSFSKAAASCYVTQATLSTMIKRLEDELDIILFDRKTSPIITTECGQAIVAEAQKVLYHSHNIKQLASILKNQIEGELKIGVIPTIAGNLLHRIVPILLDRYPNLKLSISEITTANIVRQLKLSEIDLGIISTPLENNELEEEILYYEKLMVYGQKNQDKAYIIPETISEEKVWLLEEGNCLRDQFMSVCSIGAMSMQSNLAYQPNTFESLLNFVDQMGGLTLIPELYYLDMHEEKKSKVADFQIPYPVREIGLVYHRPYAKFRLVKVLAEVIKEVIPPLLSTHQLKSHQMRIAKP
jgi:LysR family hydrogen peroxide-inducible transcriptional activator